MADLAMNYEGITDFLMKCIPDGSVSLLTSELPNNLPVLICKSEKIWAGFVLSNDDANTSYENTYARFKEDYLRHDKHASTIDPVFVFVLPSSASDVEGIASKIETDVYFCRKFVVSARTSIEKTFSRLPFLPLTAIEGADFRPPSAQTLMRSIGIHAELARYLAVTSTRSPEKIIDDCLDGRFGNPIPLEDGAPRVRQGTTERPPSVRLKSIAIENFRAYRRKQEFTFGDDVTILYGPNGFGKTSFFDAIDFAATGGIGRIRAMADEAFFRVAAHLDSSPSSSLISMDFERDGVIRTLSRRLSKGKTATIGSDEVDRKKVISELTGGASLSTERIENLVNLFRAMHLFSQDNETSLTEQNKSELSTTVVSRMLAFEDYANAVTKAARIIDVVESTTRQHKVEINRITQEMTAAEAEMSTLTNKVLAVTTSDNIPAISPALAERIRELGIDAKSVDLTPETVRGWRANSIQRKEISFARKRELQSLIEENMSIIEANSAIELSKIERDQIMSHKATTSLQSSELTNAIAKLDSSRAAARALSAALQSRCNTLEAAVRAASDRQKKLSEAQNIESNLSVAMEKFELIEKSLQEAKSQLSTIDEVISAMQAELSSVNQRSSILESLRDLTGHYVASKSKLSQTLHDRQQTRIDQEKSESEERICANLVAEIDQKIVEKTREIEIIESRQTELKNLIDQIRTHVHDSTCLLCGHSYQSRDELLSRINSFQNDSAGADIKLVLAELIEKREEATQSLDRAQIETARLTLYSSDLLRAEADLRLSQNKFVDAASAAGITNIPDEELAPKIESLLLSNRARLKQFDEEINSNTASHESALARLGAVQLESTAASLSIRNLEAARDSYAKEISRIHEQLRSFEVPLESNAQDLAAMLEESTSKMQTNDLAAASLSRDIDAKAESLRATSAQDAKLNTLAKDVDKKLAALTAAIVSYSSKLKQAGLPPETPADVLSAAMEHAAHDETYFSGLGDELISLELSIDSATTAAALLTMRNAIASQAKEIVKITASVDKLRPWASYFRETMSKVSTQQAEAIFNFTENYGPRTSVIQQRLRSVYGFEDIQMQSVDSKIMITVNRNDQSLRPADYFSQSQQQTLLLGLFITACTSQTWSSFAPVFMDDPVTHFDDLNTYAFLDLILGLTGETTPGRQFVISTCDEKFLQLARRKFRRLGDRARFYRFSAIGEDGPVVKEMA